MSDLAPSLSFLLELRYAIENGISVRDFMKDYCHNRGDALSIGARRWLYDFERGVVDRQKMYVANLYQESCLDLIAAGLEGRPILPLVKELEEEVWLACQADMEKHVSMLPIKSLLPVMFLQVPAFLLLLFGPILSQFLGEMSK